MAVSNYLENSLVNAVLRNTSYVSPPTVYIGLFTTDPTDANTGIEVTGASYSRQLVTFDTPVNGTTTNTTEISFTNATESWGAVSHIGIYDASTVGNLLFYGVLTIQKNINTNDTFKILNGDLNITLT